MNTTNLPYQIPDDVGQFTIPFWRSRFRFYLFVTLQFPSFCCNIPILYYFKWKQLKNQIYGFLLIINVLIVTTELPITLYFLYQGGFQTDHICTSWITLNYSLFIMSIFMMVWTSIERYLFIYHQYIIMQHKILLHYIPIVCIILYCPLFYISIVVLYPCQHMYNIQSYLCGGACYESEPILGTIDWIINDTCTISVIFIVNTTLIARHLIQRYRLKRAVITAIRRPDWCRSIKLLMQLLVVGILYMIARIPYSIICIIQIFHYTEELENLLITFFIYLPYIQTLFLPYIYLLFIPEIKHKCLLLFTSLYCQKIIHEKNQIYPNNQH